MNKNVLKATLFLFAFTLVGIASFAQPVQTDDSQANFTAGTPDANTQITNVSGGEIRLAPGSGSLSFSGGLPTGWTSAIYTGGSILFPGGFPVTLIDAGTVYTTAATYTKGSMMQFTAKIESVGDYQFLGFSELSNLTGEFFGVGRGNTPPAGDAQVYARILGNADVPLGPYTDNFHTYSIAWNLDDTIKFYVDGALKYSTYHLFTPTNFLAQASELNAGNARLWLQDLTVVPSKAVFTSRVFDEGFTIGWSAARWQANTPTGTSMDVLIRAGNTAVPDGSWSAWTLLPGNTVYLGSAIPGRYVQYQTVFNTGDALATPPSLDWIQLISAYLTPVTMSSLSAQTIDNDVKLDWGTASEQNNKGFQIQRSTDQVKWSNLGFVVGAGNASTPKTYSYSDKGLTSGKYFYRLEQTDLDGKTSLSNTVSATITKNLAFNLSQSYPNPSRGSSVISYTIPQSTRVRIVMYDANGKIMKVVEDAQRAAGSYTISVDQTRMTSGIYIYKMEAGAYTATKKMVIQN